MVSLLPYNIVYKSVCLDCVNTLNRNNYCIGNDPNSFIIASLHHMEMIKEWKRDIESRKDQARSYLISADDTIEIPDDRIQIEPVTVHIPTSPFKARNTTVLPVSTIEGISLPNKSDVITKFTLNKQQIFAFTIISNHLDGGYLSHNGKFSLK